MKLVYNEWYGNISFAQRSAYRKHNVTPVEHDDLVAHFGPDNHVAITKYVKEHSPNGSYQGPWLGRFA